jgi:uncharacterized membrane protein YdcZ (DUF606 family)
MSKLLPQLMLLMLPVLMGITAVIQMTFNRLILNYWDIIAMAFFNALIILVISGVLLLFQHVMQPNDKSFLAIQFNLRNFQWWFIIPPLTIVLITIVMVFTIAKISTTTAFILFILGQLCTSLVWDGWIRGEGFPIMRVFGVLMVLCGSIMVSKV